MYMYIVCFAQMLVYIILLLSPIAFSGEWALPDSERVVVYIAYILFCWGKEMEYNFHSSSLYLTKG